MSVVKPIQFGDKYLLLDQIGSGGVAEVFRGKLTRDKGFEKLIVIKKLLAEHNSDREMVDIFIREARLAALLQHENIAATYDFGAIEGEYFLAMEYLFGKNLHSVMVRAREHRELFGLSEALVIGSKICEGMEYAHNLNDLQHKPLNIVHRDLTPHNIFITYDGKVKILDFGVAKAELFDNKTREGVVKGKISYMSPERLSGEDVDARSDIFSIGILLYEMVSGRRMYQGDTAELIRKSLTAEYDNLRTVLPDLDPAIYHILDKALAVEIDRRYQSCAQMQSDIDDLLFQMQQRGGHQLLKEAVRELFAAEYETEHKKIAEVLSFENEAAGQYDKTGSAIIGDRGSEEWGAEEDKTSLLLRRPPVHLAKLYWSRLRAWGEDTYLLIRDMADRQQLGLPVLVGGAAVVLLLLIVLFSLGGRQEEPTPSSVTEKTVRKEVDPAPAPVVEEADPQETETTEVADTGREAEEETVEGEAPVVIQETVEPQPSASEKPVVESQPLLPETPVAKPAEPAVEEAAPTAPVAPDATKVVVLKKEELKKKKVVSETVQPSIGVAARTVDQETKPEEQKARIEQVDSAKRNESFAAQTDNLARQVKLESLHLKAREAMRQGRLIQPTQQSAQAYFNQILFIDPEDKVAVEGLRLICEKYSTLAEESLVEKQFDRAENYVSDGLSVIPNYRRLLEVKSRIGREREEHIHELSEKARLCLEAKKLSTPPDDSAYFYYNEIARLDPESALVRKGYKDIADGYALMAEEAFRNFDYDSAEVYVRRGLQIVPDHYYLMSLKQELGRSDFGRFGHSMKKKLNKLLSE